MRGFTGMTRAKYLTLVGVVQVAQGFTWVTPDGVTESRSSAFQWVPFLEPAHLGMVMLATGLLAVVAGLARARRLETIGFALSMIPYSLLSFTFLFAYLFGDLHTGFVSAISYGALALMMVAGAGIVDPVELPKQGEGGRR